MKLRIGEMHHRPVIIIITVVAIAAVISLISFIVDLSQLGPRNRKDVITLNPATNEIQFEIDSAIALVKLHKAKTMVLDSWMKVDNVDESFETIKQGVENIVQIAEEVLREIASMNPADSKSREKKVELLALIQKVIDQAKETRTLIELGNTSIIQRALTETMTAIDRVIEFHAI